MVAFSYSDGRTSYTLLTLQCNYFPTSNISCNEIVDHSDVVGAAPVSTSSFSTLHLTSVDLAETTARWDWKHLSVRICCNLYYRLNSFAELWIWSWIQRPVYCTSFLSHEIFWSTPSSCINQLTLCLYYGQFHYVAIHLLPATWCYLGS